MTDVLTLLTEANPVRADELAPMDFSVLHPRRPRNRLILAAVAAVLIAGGATSIAVGALGGSSPSSGSGQPAIGPFGGPTLEHPLLRGEPIPLALAPAMLGAPVVLPDSSFVRPSDFGVVEGVSRDGQRALGVTFPAQGLIVIYERPGIHDPQATFEGIANSEPGSTRLISLAGTPAVATPRGPETSSWSSIEFVAGGTTVTMLSHSDLQSLQRAAQSIVDHPAGATLVLGGVQLPPLLIAGRVPLWEASSALGGPLALPDRSLMNRATTGLAWVQCARPVRRSQPCTLWVTSRSLSVIYERPSPWPHSRSDYKEFAENMPRGAVRDLDGVPAVISAGARSIYFTVGGTRVVVGGHLALPRLEEIARSIVERSRAK